MTHVQKKPTLYPEWNKSFDIHIHEGRVVALVVMCKPDQYVAEVTVEMETLSNKCRNNAGGTCIWVSARFC